MGDGQIELMPADQRALFRPDLGRERAHHRLVAKAINRIGGCTPQEWPLLAARLLDLEAEVERLRAELTRWESGQRRKGLPVVESVPDGITYAARLVRAQGTEGGDDHDDLLREAADRLKRLSDAASCLIAEREALRAQVESAERRGYEQAITDLQARADELRREVSAGQRTHSAASLSLHYDGCAIYLSARLTEEAME